ncbi:cytochrome c oxidase assembly protein [Actinomadura atramentaria]|uniref:cytochrome c oxidase assembly protein n=1 Tax=Actinomadura atramentaria TaxID=1990 RepID=UPI000382396C|nr:cytochrome c oxidase assembly protein [Actinomadura atramentaria]
MTHHAAGPLDALAPGAAVLVLAAAYLAAAVRVRRRDPARPWSTPRTAAFLTGCALLVLAAAVPDAHHDFRAHMLQHLLLGMYAPLALVLGAPVTLALRALPPARARRLVAVLRSRPARAFANPPVALLLSTGSLAVVYFTPLYNATAERPALHLLLHVHFVLSGCLFAWVVAGPDPAPARPGVPARLVVVGVAVAAHGVVAQLMYGGVFVDVHAPVDQVRGGAEIMYYGGDVAELLLAAALVATWRPVRRAAARA